MVPVDGFIPDSFDNDVARRVLDEGSPTNLAVKEVSGTSAATVAKAGTVKRASGVAPIANPSTATAPQVAETLNDLIAKLNSAGIIA